MQDGCEYLIATTQDGRLDLLDVYVHDADLDIYARPFFIGDIPSQPQAFQQIRWRAITDGEILKGKEEVVKVTDAALTSKTCATLQTFMLPVRGTCMGPERQFAGLQCDVLFYFLGLT